MLKINWFAKILLDDSFNLSNDDAKLVFKDI